MQGIFVVVVVAVVGGTWDRSYKTEVIRQKT